MEGHVGADQNHEGRFLDATIAQSRIAFFEVGVERLLHIRGELAGLVNFVFQRDFFYQAGELVNGLVGDGVFAGGDFQRVRRSREVEVVGFYAAGGRVGAGVGVYGEEEVGLGLVGDGGAGFEGDEGVVVAGVDDVGSEALLEQLAEAQGYVEDDLFFFNSSGTGGAGVVAAVAGVDDDASDFQAQGAHQGALAGSRGLGSARGRDVFGFCIRVDGGDMRGMGCAWLGASDDRRGRGGREGAVIRLGSGGGAGHRGSNGPGGGMGGGLHAVGLLAEGGDFLVVGAVDVGWRAARLGRQWRRR